MSGEWDAPSTAANHARGSKGATNAEVVHRMHGTGTKTQRQMFDAPARAVMHEDKRRVPIHTRRPRQVGRASTGWWGPATKLFRGKKRQPRIGRKIAIRTSKVMGPPGRIAHKARAGDIDGRTTTGTGVKPV